MTTGIVITFAVLSAVTIALASYRLLVVRLKGDDCLHLLDDDAPVVARQQAAAAKLEIVDRWGKALTLAAVVAGLAAYAVWWLDL